MQHDKYTMFRNRLAKLFAHRRKKAARENVSCYRLYDLDLPEFPLAIDLYEHQVHAAEYRRNHTLSETEHAEWLAQSRAVIAAVLGIPEAHIHIKQRAVITDRKEQYARFAERGERSVVRENGVRFLVNLSDYLDTGLFLDHRPTRQRVKELSAGKDVLNLYAYTGSFSVYAALGKARSVQTVDLSNTYLDWARDNFSCNDLNPADYRFVAADVLSYLPTLPSSSFDLIVCDPPTFSNSKKMPGVFDVQRDHPALLNQCLRLLREDGLLIFSTNNRRFRLFDDHIATASIKDITRQTTGFDFEGKLDRQCYELRPDESRKKRPSGGKDSPWTAKPSPRKPGG
jgi:23S rRNA (cytosine1962-C5)-methyltransferase